MEDPLERNGFRTLTPKINEQAKRTNVGIALITNPRVLFLDEPTSGLDRHCICSFGCSVMRIDSTHVFMPFLYWLHATLDGHGFDASTTLQDGSPKSTYRINCVNNRLVTDFEVLGATRSYTAHEVMRVVKNLVSQPPKSIFSNGVHNARACLLIGD